MSMQKTRSCLASKYVFSKSVAWWQTLYMFAQTNLNLSAE